MVESQLWDQTLRMDKAELQREGASLNTALEEHRYPVQFSIEYPEASNRLTVLLRAILAIPVFVIMQLVSGDLSMFDPSYYDLESDTSWDPILSTAAVLWIAPLLMIVVRYKYPLWVFNTYLELSRFTARVEAYLLLLRDEYPSLDEEQAVSLQIEYPDVRGQLNRFLPIVKWLLAFPHYIVLVGFFFAVIAVTVVAWFTILIKGRYPRGMFSFVEGTLRWGHRVFCYAFMLTTDRYPPFSFRP